MQIKVNYYLLLILLFCFSELPLSAQKNRFGMALSGSDGNYALKDSAKICPLIVGGCAALPADACKLMPA
ncbi:MAG: hypothetical protein MUE99_09535, partial [Chitinophagaceae bacterium]|nr:hypothetical protein [Chitinophagaceae bacterium]